MTENEILTGLAEIVNDVTGIPAADVQPAKSFTDDLETLVTVGDAVAYNHRAGVPA